MQTLWSVVLRSNPSATKAYTCFASVTLVCQTTAVVESLYAVLQAYCHIPRFRDPLLKSQRLWKVIWAVLEGDAAFSLPAERDVVAVAA